MSKRKDINKYLIAMFGSSPNRKKGYYPLIAKWVKSGHSENKIIHVINGIRSGPMGLDPDIDLGFIIWRLDQCTDDTDYVDKIYQRKEEEAKLEAVPNVTEEEVEEVKKMFMGTK